MLFSCIYYIIFVMVSIKCFLKLIHKPCNSKVCLMGKTAVITGGNKGIGFETSLGLAARGCKVIIACRDKSEKVKEDIIKITKNPNIIIKYLDLTSFVSIRKFCQEIHQSEEKIDILINNAGIASADKTQSVDNLNKVMQTNLIGPFLLTHLLVDLLKKPGHARLIFVSSITIHLQNLTVENLKVPPDHPVTFMNSLRIYANTKAGQVVLSNEFAEKLKPFGITSNALHPGGVNTDLYREISETNALSSTWLWLWYNVVGKLLLRTPEEGAQRILKMAMDDEFINTTGTFYWYLSLVPTCINDKNFRRNIWKAIQDLVMLSPDEKI